MKRIEVVDYDPAWPAVYESLRARIWPAISDLAMGMEHVGSTAVPGLAAKPVIDIDVIAVPSLVPEVIARIETVGYKHRGDLGIPKREAFVVPAGLPRHHLYLCPLDSEALANHLAVRDALRASISDARAYGELKENLAREFAQDVDRYVEGKTEFLVDLLEKVGFADKALIDIRNMNAR